MCSKRSYGKGLGFKFCIIFGFLVFEFRRVGDEWVFVLFWVFWMYVDGYSVR